MTARGWERDDWEDTNRAQTVKRGTDRLSSHDRGNSSAPRRHQRQVSSAMASPKRQLRASYKAF